METYFPTVDCRIFWTFCGAVRFACKEIYKRCKLRTIEGPEKHSVQVEALKYVEELHGRAERHSVHPVAFGTGRCRGGEGVPSTPRD